MFRVLVFSYNPGAEIQFVVYAGGAIPFVSLFDKGGLSRVSVAVCNEQAVLCQAVLLVLEVPQQALGIRVGDPGLLNQVQHRRGRGDLGLKGGVTWFDKP